MGTKGRGGHWSAWVIAMVIGLSACGGDDEARTPADPPASSGPSSPGSPIPSPTDQTTDGAEDPESIPTGDPPAVDYVQGTVAHRRDGSTLELQLGADWGVIAVHRTDDGFFVTDGRWFEGTVGMHRLTDEGKRLGSWSSTGPPLRSAEGELAWVSVVPPETGETGPTRIHAGELSQTLTQQMMPGLLSFSDGMVTYTARVRASGRRWADRRFRTNLVDPPVAAASREVRVLSPDGSHWYAVVADALVIGSVDGKTADARKIALGSEGAGGLILETPPVWEDASHLLVQYTDDDRATLVRVSPDGSMVRTLDWSGNTALEWAVPVG